MKTQAELNAEAIAQAEDDAIDREARIIFGKMLNTTGSGPKLMVLRGVVRDHRAELRQLRRENARLRAVAEAAKIVARMYSTFEVVRNELDPALKELEAPHEG